MADTAAATPIPTDGWKSRKIIMGGATMGLMLVFGAAALWTNKADFNQVVGLFKYLVPSILVPLFTAMGLKDLAEAKRG